MIEASSNYYTVREAWESDLAIKRKLPEPVMWSDRLPKQTHHRLATAPNFRRYAALCASRLGVVVAT